MVKLQVLGSGDAFGSGGRFQTCFQLSGPSGNLLIDCGASSLIAMKRWGVDPSQIGWILLSHLHGDHFGGIPFFILDGQFGKRKQPLVVAGPPGVRERIQASLEVFFPGSSSISFGFPIEFVELRQRATMKFGPWSVTPFPVVHPSGAPAYALRVELGGKTIAYSGDTQWTEVLLEAARGADLFLCEAYFFEKQVRYHLDYRTVREKREQLECRQMLLTHANQDLLSRLDEVEIDCAQDGQVMVV